VTTREKGTGLGLAIVGKILEGTAGGSSLRDAAEKFPAQRARMRLRFCGGNRRKHSSVKPRTNERATTMASIYLIIDDGGRYPRAVAGILEDEGLHRHARRASSDDAAAAIAARRPNLVS